MGKMRRGCAKCRQVRPLPGAPPQVPGSRAGQEGPCSAVTTDPRLMANPGSLLENSRLVLGFLVQGV